MEHQEPGLVTQELSLEPVYLTLKTEIALVLLNDYKNHYLLLNVLIIQKICRKINKLSPKSRIQFLYNFAIWV